MNTEGGATLATSSTVSWLENVGSAHSANPLFVGAVVKSWLKSMELFYSSWMMAINEETITRVRISANMGFCAANLSLQDMFSAFAFNSICK